QALEGRVPPCSWGIAAFHIAGPRIDARTKGIRPTFRLPFLGSTGPRWGRLPDRGADLPAGSTPLGGVFPTSGGVRLGLARLANAALDAHPVKGAPDEDQRHHEEERGEALAQALAHPVGEL